MHAQCFDCSASHGCGGGAGLLACLTVCYLQVGDTVMVWDTLRLVREKSEKGKYAVQYLR